MRTAIYLLAVVLLLNARPGVSADWFYIGAGVGMPTTETDEDYALAVEAGQHYFDRVGLTPEVSATSNRKAGGSFDISVGADLGRFLSVEVTAVKFSKARYEVNGIIEPGGAQVPANSKTSVETHGLGAAIVGRVPISRSGLQLAARLGMLHQQSKASTELCVGAVVLFSECRQLFEGPTLKYSANLPFGSVELLLPTKRVDLLFGLTQHQTRASLFDEHKRNTLTTVAFGFRVRPFP